GSPISNAWPPQSTVMSACSTTGSCPKITLPIAAFAAATWVPVASAWRTIMSSSFSSPSVAAAMRSAPSPRSIARVGYGSDRVARPVGLDQKTCNIGATPYRSSRAAAVASNPSQLLEITLFFTGCDPASTQVYLDRSTEARERLNSLGFSVQSRLCPRGDRFARNHDPVETAVTTQVPGRQWQTKGAGALNSS